MDREIIEKIKKRNNSKFALWYEDHLIKGGPNYLNNLNLIERNNDLIDQYFVTTFPKSIKTNINKIENPLEKISNIHTYEQEKIHAALKLWKLHNTPVVGASGALYGLLAAFGMLFPNSKLFIFPIPFPIPAKYFVIGLVYCHV